MKKSLTTLCWVLTGLAAQAQWNPNTSVNLEVAALPVSDVQTLGTPDGKTWIAYYHQNNANYDMRAQLLDAAGNKLLGNDGVLVNAHTSGSATYVFNICLTGEGDLVIAAQDQRTGSSNTAVAYKIDQSGNSVWNGADGIELGGGLSPYPAALPNGEVIIAWNDNNSKLSLQKITASGTAAWTTPKQFLYGTANLSRGQLVPMSDNGYVMVFQRRSTGINSNVYAQRFNNNGDSVWTSSVRLSDQATSSVRYYSITHEADTTYFGYYTSQSNHFNSWLQRINPDGTLPYGNNGSAFSDYNTSADPHEQTTNIALTPGSPYVWAVCNISSSNQNQFGVYVQKFAKADGARQFNVLGKEVYAINADRYQQQGGLALKNDQPVFMVCTDQSYLIKGTILNASGDFLLPAHDVELSSTTIAQPSSLTKGRFGFTSNVNGQSVAVWTENRGTEIRAYAQNFDLSVYDTSIAVTTQNNVPAVINTNGGTLQMKAAVLPATANQNVTWSIISGTGTATISTTGLVTALTNGTVWAKAISVAAPSKADSLEITISNQDTTVTVATQGGAAPTITIPAGTLQMTAAILPATASQNVTWSIVPGTGTATISTTGLVTAQTNGTVWAKAISVAAPSKADSLEITISDQPNAVNELDNMIGLSMYPNPAHNTLTIQAARLHPDMHIIITDMKGLILYEQKIAKNSLSAPLPIATGHLAPGIYLLQCKGAGVSLVKKFSKE